MNEGVARFSRDFAGFLFEVYLCSKEKKGTLLWVIDKTRTALGKRHIRKWVEQPLVDPFAIESRLNSVDELVSNQLLCSELRESLSGIYDLERLMTRIIYGTASARELRQLCATLKKVPQIKNLLSETRSKLLRQAFEKLDLLEDIAELIDAAIVEEPPVSVREGKMINEGYNEELDILRNDLNNGQGVISSIEANERERTGIKIIAIYSPNQTNCAPCGACRQWIEEFALDGDGTLVVLEDDDNKARILSFREIFPCSFKFNTSY